jgi:hypothetical protein
MRTIEISNLGRGKVTVKAYVQESADPDSIANAILEVSRPHLMSSEVDAIWNEKTKKGQVIVGGFRQVGEAKEIK